MPSQDLAKVDPWTRQIEVLKQATAEIRTCTDIGRVKRTGDMAAALRMVAKRVGASVETQNAATEATLWARRREGELLKDFGPDHGGDRKSESRSHDATLIDLGITKSESSRAKSLAAIPDPLFEAALETATEDGEELTTGKLVQLGRSIQKGEEKERAPPEADPEVERATQAANRWTKIVQEFAMLLRSFRKAGGVEELTRSWGRDKKEDFLEVLRDDIDALQKIHDELAEVLS